MRTHCDISSYLVVGPDDTCGRPVVDIVRAALRAGITMVQLRAKHSDAKDMIALCEQIAQCIAEEGKNEQVGFVVDDRLDVVLAARDAGIKVDGIHVGQSDIPVAFCRKVLGPDAIVGLSANTVELVNVLQQLEPGIIDYVGAGALHPTRSKADARLIQDAQDDSHALEDIAALCRVCRYPVVVGGGVSVRDLPDLVRAGAQGWFVISAIAGADNPYDAALELVTTWREEVAQQRGINLYSAHSNHADTHTAHDGGADTESDTGAALTESSHPETYVNTLAQVAVWPVGTGEELSAHVAKAVEVIHRSGLPATTHAMSTDLEGDFPEVMRTIEQAVLALYQTGVRTQASIQLDLRAGVTNQIHEKVAVVEQLLHKPLQ